MSYADATRTARSLTLPADAPVLDIRLGGSVNTDFLIPGLTVRLAQAGYASRISSVAHGGWIAEVLGGAEADVWVIWLATLGLTRGGTARPNVDSSSIGAALRRLDDSGSNVIVVLPEATPLEADPFSPFASWRRALHSSLRQVAPERTVLVDVDHIVRRRGASGWDAPRYWEQAKAAAHPDAVTEVAEHIGDIVARLLRPAVRGIVVDLDDTLWGGTVGEVGPSGLSLDPDGEGRPFLELQRWLVDLRDSGIALGVASKNDESVVRSAFDERPELLLRPSDFLTFDISWEPKHHAIERFASTLNVGIDAVCFLDDRPAERDEARTMLPGLIVPELPERPAERVSMLIGTGLFLTPRPDDTDVRRVADLIARRDDETLNAGTTDLEGYLAGLQMRLQCAPITSANFDRSLSLLHKTNQFNLTLWRPSPNELRTLTRDPDQLALCFRLQDRVGDAGIIAVTLAHIDRSGSDPVGIIDAWILSCRAFNRGVEWAIAERLERWRTEHEITAIRLPFVVGPRNGIAAEVPGRLGLHDRGDGVFEGPRFGWPTHFITLEEDA